MAVADNLITDEKIIFESKKHWMAPVRASLVAALMTVGGVILYRLSPDWDGLFSFVGSILDLVAIGLFIGGIGWIVYNVVAWGTAEFAVTDMRVLREEGLVRRRSSTTLLSGLSDVEVGRRLPRQQARLWRCHDPDPVGRRGRGPLPVHHEADRVPERGHEPEGHGPALECRASGRARARSRGSRRRRPARRP